MAHMKQPENSSWYSPDKMAKFAAVRAITSETRPPGSHGCKLVEIIPGISHIFLPFVASTSLLRLIIAITIGTIGTGLWTSHFQDISEPDSFDKLLISPPIGLVVNAAVAYNQCPTYLGFYGPDIHVLPIPVFDDPKEGEPHLCAGDAKQYFEVVNKSIKQTFAEGKSVIIHCMGSLSRSITFIMAYLMESLHLNVEDAAKLIKSKWDATWPNDSFVFQLIKYENELKQNS